MTAELRSAAQVLRSAEALLIGAGAGMGVDSGLPDFRGALHARGCGRSRCLGARIRLVNLRGSPYPSVRLGQGPLLPVGLRVCAAEDSPLI
jgi:hypothetical protein